ncbi:stalk domain-containing protein [Microlunatus sp. GCM10028923]|uniref:stalk domain-containing protein n=1 Tax=Microlunatus sp. GCM10028923 TaxID=3273400 RepID=UPI0036235F41
MAQRRDLTTAPIEPPAERQPAIGRRTFLQLAAAVGLTAATVDQLAVPAAAAEPAWPAGQPAVLVDETFAFMVDFDPRSLAASGWEVADLAGKVTYAFGSWLRAADTSAGGSVALVRSFRPVEAGLVVWDFRFEPIGSADGASFALLDDRDPVIELIVSGGQLVYRGPTGDTALGAVAAGGKYGVRVELDLGARTAAVIVNGDRVLTGAGFAGTGSRLNRLRLATGHDQLNDLYLGPIRLIANHHLVEDFVATYPGALPERWTSTATSQVVQARHARTADNFCVSLTSTGASTTYTALSGVGSAYEFEMSFLATSIPGGLVITLSPGGHQVRLRVASSKLWLLRPSGSDQEVSSVNYSNRIWHHVRVVVGNGAADVWHNGKQRLTGAALPTQPAGDPTKITVDLPTGGTVLIDDVIIRPWVGYPNDYVAEPQPVTTGAQLVGIQSCNIWREGYHRGWDVVSQYPERHPLLGFYDEGLPEVADWETKWLAENGIGFQMYCWYRPQGGRGTPIKVPRLGQHLHQGYFASRWSSHQKFMIQWENTGEPTDSADFRTHLVPYWLEYYFKDPRYLVIDDKPVLAIYSMAKLVEHFGSVTAARAELDHLDGVAVSAGFAGITVIGNAAGNYPDLALDAEYSYSRKGYFDTQTAGMLARRSTGVDVIATISHGRNDLAWNGPWGEYASPATVGRIAEWVRDVFIPGAAAGALSRQLILLDNWNEYGEGHFLFPSELHGFGYLEAIRKIFGTTAGPANTTPTAAHRGRVGLLYPPGRSLPSVVRDEPPLGSQVTYSWTFDVDGDLQGWSDLEHTVDGLAVSGGALRGTAITNDPRLVSPDDLGLVAADHPYVHVRMRAGATSEQELFFIQPGNTTYSRDRGLVWHAEPDANGVIEADIPVWQCPTWQGTISQIRIDPLITTGDFAIEEVTLRRSAAPPPYITVNGERRTDLPVTEVSGQAYLPALGVAKVINRRAEWDPVTAKVRLKDGHAVVTATIGSATGDRDGTAFTMAAAARLDDHDRPLLPLSYFTAGMAATASWNGTSLSLAVPASSDLTVTVNPDGTADFVSVAEAVASIADSGPDRPYVVEIAPGSYPQVGWTLPSYITLRGTDPDTCLLAGSLPDDATDAEITNTSTLWIKGTATLENLTISAANMRYAVHSESSGNNRNAVHKIKNCRIEHSGNQGARTWRQAHPESGMAASTVWASDRPWGYGTASGVVEEFTDCTFVGTKEPWYLHTNADFTAPSTATLERCAFQQTGALSASALTLQSLGSGQADKVTIIDSTFNGVYLRHDDKPWISQQPARQVADHAEIQLTVSNSSLLGYRPNLRGRALRITAADTTTDQPIGVSGSAAPLLFGAPIKRAGGGGLAGYAYGQWDISGIAVGLGSNVTVDNTLGRRLGDCATTPKELSITVGKAAPVTVRFSTDLRTADNGTVLTMINSVLGSLATADAYDVGLGEGYPSFPDRELGRSNTGTLGIPRFAAVVADGAGVRLYEGSGTPIGVALEPLAPGVEGRILTAGNLWRGHLPGLTGNVITQGTDVYYGPEPGTFALTGTAGFGSAIIDDWIRFDLR